MAGAWLCVCALFWEWNVDSCHLTNFAWRSAKLRRRLHWTLITDTVTYTLSYFWKWNSFRFSFPNVRAKCSSCMRPSMYPFINKHLEATWLKFEHIYWYDRNENRCRIRNIAIMLRRYHFSPSSQICTALATGKTMETATEVACFMVSDWDYVRLAGYRGAGAHAQSIFSTTGQSRQAPLLCHSVCLSVIFAIP